MKPTERDDLLIRIDERLRGIKDGDEGDIPKIEKHLETLNGTTSSNKTQVAINRVLAVLALMLSSGAVGLSKLLGFW